MNDIDKINAFDEVVALVRAWRLRETPDSEILTEAIELITSVKNVTAPFMDKKPLVAKNVGPPDVSPEETAAVFALCWRYHKGHTLFRILSSVEGSHYRCSCGQALHFAPGVIKA